MGRYFDKYYVKSADVNLIMPSDMMRSPSILESLVMYQGTIKVVSQQGKEYSVNCSPELYNSLRLLAKHTVMTSSYASRYMGLDGQSYFLFYQSDGACCWTPYGMCCDIVTVFKEVMSAIRDNEAERMEKQIAVADSLRRLIKTFYSEHDWPVMESVSLRAIPVNHLDLELFSSFCDDISSVNVDVTFEFDGKDFKDEYRKLYREKYEGTIQKVAHWVYALSDFADDGYDVSFIVDDSIDEPQICIEQKQFEIKLKESDLTADKMISLLKHAFFSVLSSGLSKSDDTEISVATGDSVVVHRINPFHYNRYVNVIRNDSIHERDEHDGLMFKILSDSTAEFVNYRNDSTIRIDSLIIPDWVSIDSKRYEVVGIAASCLWRDYAGIMGVPYDPEADMSYFGPSWLFIPPSVKYIAEGAFFGNMNLKTVVFSEGLEEIGDAAFNWSGLTEIDIPSTVRAIGYYAFADSYFLDRITVSPENSFYDSRGDCNAVVETARDYMFITGKSTVFPDDVKRIHVINAVPKLRLGSRSQCVHLWVGTYYPKVVNLRRCKSLKSLEVAFNHQSAIKKIILAPNLEYLHVSRVHPDKIKGKLMKRSVPLTPDDDLIETRRYFPVARLYEVKIERSPRH